MKMNDEAAIAKKLRKLRRIDLLELLLNERRENEALKEKIKELEEIIAAQDIEFQNAGTLAEAALKLNKIFADADAAAEKNEPELCGIALSEDQFHPYPDPWVRNLLSGLSFFQPDTKRVAPGKTQYLIREGRAKALEDSPGEYRLRDLSPTDWAVDQIDTNIDPNGEQILQICDGQLYLCANGNIVNCCDFSYEHADLDPVCSVFETNWPERWYRETLRRKKRENPDA